MLRRYITGARAHYRLGYSLAFACVLMPFLLLAAADVLRYREMGGNPFSSGAYALPGASSRDLRVALEIAAFLLLIPPLFIGAARIWQSYYGLNAPFRGNRWGAAVLMLACAVVGFCVLWTSQMQRDGGYAWNENGMGYAFTSWLVAVTRYTPFAITAWASGAMTVVGSVTLGFLTTDRLPPKLVEYAKRVEDADLRRKFYPNHRRDLIYANAGLAPRTPFVTGHAARIVRHCNDGMVGTRTWDEKLREPWRETEQSVRDLFVPRAGEGEWDVHLVPGTMRALEIAIRQFALGDEPVTLVFSPYEHPAEGAVAKYLKNTTNRIDYVALKFSRRSVEDSWTEQRDELVELAVDAMSSTRSIFVMSEVCWLTGTVLPLTEVFGAIRRAQRDRGVRHHSSFIIDGAHAAGNLPALKHLDACDAYVFSAHKWLMAQEPSGVLLTRRGTLPSLPYDAFGSLPPASTVAISAVANVRAGMELIARLGERKHKRSENLIALFKEQFPKGPLRIVGHESKMGNRGILSVWPGSTWKWENASRRELERALSDGGIVASVIMGEDLAGLIPTDTPSAVVRLAFHYFLSRSHIVRLARKLSSLTQEKGG